MQIIVITVFQLLHFALPAFSLSPVFLTGWDVVVLDEAVIVVLHSPPNASHHSHLARHVWVRGVLRAVLADPVGLLEQGVPVAGQKAVEEPKLHGQNDKE